MSINSLWDSAEEQADRLIESTLFNSSSVDNTLQYSSALKNIRGVNFKLAGMSNAFVCDQYKHLSRQFGDIDIPDSFIDGKYTPGKKAAPPSGLIVPASDKFEQVELPANDLSFLLEFVNITNVKGILKWVHKYGAIKLYSGYPNRSQPVDDFIKELHKLRTLYHLFSAIKQFEAGEKEPLIQRVKTVKVADYFHEWESSGAVTHQWWGEESHPVTDEAEQFPNPLKVRQHPLSRSTIEKLKKREGFFFLIDGEPVPTCFKATDNLSDQALLTAVWKVICNFADEGINREHGLTYVATAQISAGMLSIAPVIRCLETITLLYFQLLWLISSDGTRICKKCHQTFPPSGKRPGKQLYCGKCGGHPSQDKYKQRELAAIKDYKSGLTLEESAANHNIKTERLKKILEKGV